MKKNYGHVVNFIMFQTNLNKFGSLCLVLNHLFCGQARFDGLIWLLETIPYQHFCHCLGFGGPIVSTHIQMVL